MPGGEAFPGGEQGLPGGMQAPPPGALTSPPLASKLTPFFAIAFDSKNKEVYAVTHRWTGRKTEGLLYRYTYPDFKPNGSYNLPNLATKAVIDTEKGMLYLASANLTNPNTTRTVAQMHYDRAFASGDIQVFDLAPIRNGKVEIRSELKPAAVVPMGGSIRGLELSADGKSAYVVVNRTSGRVTKSFLRQIDTATRKQIREKAMPEQMAAMRLSPDGKEIVALEYPTAPNKPVSVFVYDADSWALRAIPLPGASTDVAITTDGILLAGVIGTGAPSAAKLQMLGTQGTLPAEIPTVGWKASNNGYVAFSPDAKRLYVSSLGGFGPNGPANPGLDVYEIEDVEDVKTYKKIASVRDSGGVSIGGYFNLSPDGEYILFRTGAVLETAKLAENSGLAPGAVPPMPGTFPPGAGLPGMPPAPATPPAFPPGNEGEPAMPGAVVP